MSSVLNTAISTGDQVLDDYTSRVIQTIQTIYYSLEPSVGFCRQCFDEGISIRSAANRWLEDKLTLNFVFQGVSMGVNRYEVKGNRHLTNVTLPINPNETSNVVIYHGDNKSLLAPFKGDLISTVLSVRHLWEIN